MKNPKETEKKFKEDSINANHTILLEDVEMEEELLETIRDLERVIDVYAEFGVIREA